MKSSRILAPASLVAASVLFVATLPWHATFLGGLLHAFAEASMIGGLADWFAVVALFRHPLGLPIPHTAIIPRHRAKLTGGIIDMVQNRWLTKEVILERIEGWNISTLLLSTLDRVETRERILHFLRGALREGLRDIDDTRLSDRLAQLLARSLHTGDIIRWMKLLGERGMAHGWQRTVFTHAVGQASEWLGTPSVRAVIVRHLRDVAEEYASNPVRRLGKWMAESINALNYDDLAEAIVRTMSEEFARMQQDDAHPARGDFDRWLGAMIEGLETREDVRASVEQWRVHLVEGGRAAELLAPPVNRLRAWLLADLDRDDSVLLQQLRGAMEKALARFAADAEAQRGLDQWSKEKIASLVDRYHGEIGAMVSRNLDRLDDDQLVRQIEEKAGDDLQFIRVNGAIVGGLVGAGIFLVKHFLLG
ncbi:MAG: DUF445 domain-containing protein [Bacteroidota bacterium]|nr:DUF445 domain-containing protein [Bacteroidota bacterium]